MPESVLSAAAGRLGWQDGQPFSTHFGDVYFSADSGLAETHHVFLDGNALPQRWAALPARGRFTVGETGFGTGLNFLCAWQVFVQTAPASASLDFFSIEKFPLDDEELAAALALWPELQGLAVELLARWRRRVPGWNRWHLAGGRVRLTLVIGDVAAALPELAPASIDAWFLDGFSPAKNPDMWVQPVLAGLARASSPGATLATYTSAGWVRRGLLAAGFTVEKAPGFGRKREMLRGGLITAAPAMARPPATALVIGGGLAGCAAAAMLARRGLAVTLTEQSDTLAAGASGNPRGVLHARFSAGMNPLHRLVLAAYGHALALFDEYLPVDGAARAECGLLQLAFSEAEAKRIAKLAAGDWPESLFRPVDAATASELSGIEVGQAGLWFPAGGWLVPPLACQQLLALSGVTPHLGRRAERWQRLENGWQVTGSQTDGQTWTEAADIVVVACAWQARSLVGLADWPLTPVRGQISEIAASAASEALRAVICADGYCTPARAGQHLIGATHQFDDESCALRASDHADNLAQLAAHLPAWHRALAIGADQELRGRASVRCSAPGALPLIGEIQPGLFCSLAHGTRGLLTAGLAGEWIAATACRQLSPLPQSVAAALYSEKRLRPACR